MNARSFKSFCDGPISLAERSATKNKGPGRLSGNLKRMNGGRRTAKLLKILQHLDELGSCLRDHLDELVVWDLIVIYRLPQDFGREVLVQAVSARAESDELCVITSRQCARRRCMYWQLGLRLGV